MNIWKHRMLKNRSLVHGFKTNIGRGETSREPASFGCEHPTFMVNLLTQAKFQLPSEFLLSSLYYRIFKCTPLILGETDAAVQLPILQINISER